jgi:DNA ligase (NAD+)
MSSPIDGKKIVFTGKMESGERDDLVAQATALGADVDTSVSSHTDYLVHGVQTAHNAKSTKLHKAKELGVTVLDEAAYLDMIAG